MDTNKLFFDTAEYLCLEYIANGKVKIEKGSIVNGHYLNLLRLPGLCYKFAPIPSVSDKNYTTSQEILTPRYSRGVLRASVQDCCIYLPCKGDMKGNGFEGLHLITTFSEADNEWTAQINDWYGDRSQIDVVIYKGKDLTMLLRGLVLYCVYFGIITEDQFVMFLEGYNSIKERRLTKK